MTPSLTDQLCTKCGICCNGSLFSDVELTGPREATPLEAMGLEVEENSLLLHPCRALVGTRCAIYAHRPECCRTFECGILYRVRHRTMTTEEAGAIISKARRTFTRTRELAEKLHPAGKTLPLKELCQEALAHDHVSSPEQDEMKKAWTETETLVEKVFLDSAPFTT